MPLQTEFEDIVQCDVPMAEHTWFKLGGPVEYFAQPTSIEQLEALVQRCREEDVRLRLLGGGSNVLVRDEGLQGMVVQLAGDLFQKIETRPQRVVAGGGAKLGHVISTAVRAGWGGLETMVGIPGTIGGALHGNAGGRGGDIGQWTCQATVMTRAGEIHQRQRDDLAFGYRESSLDELVILEAQFELEEEDPEELTKRMQKLWIIKKANQPLAHQSAGCIFKNPRGMSAAMLIEQAGLKGARVGQVVVSERHANFMIAEQGATAKDVLQLIDQIHQAVAERLGVELEKEIEIW
ncbi:MAG: UDP-N-acetylmuramate dehydrogenase [Planctomycetales bacterium]|nr:UDP-N-acetylmuramate dehydrogenase [Planctomycetales bacterium]NIM09944.1 UDP-N-acetylmuramate dehydrogenase [Planctomycetales bacterium]NIN09384.1 UDP-N-acetylmuramate dehydrogenase [Planctomycetales bacterium]NIN78491.1 UDP-N-acetylmuramate dehydrogenase [Planctomycetales bacterium]NIO35683.1 UDP-N-acetylmuramate dehydrogenase [Planctomycetales bacterium]